MTQMKTRNALMVALPLLADGATFLAVLIFLPDFTQSLVEPSGWNALLLVLFYLLFCVGVYLIRKLEPWTGISQWQPPSFLLLPRTRVILAFIFGLLMMSTVAYQIGYFESIQSVGSSTLDEGDSSALLVYMPGALLGFSMLYILVLAFPVEANVPAQSRRFPILALLGLVLANGMLFFTTAQARAIVTALSIADGVGLYVASFLILLLSFAPPRSLFQNKQPSPFGLVSFVVLLLFASWQIVS